MPTASTALSLGNHLRRLRSQSGLTLRQVEAMSRGFPERVGFDHLSRIESGRLLPSVQKLITLARVYDVPPQQLLDVVELAQYQAYAPRTRDAETCRREGVRHLEQGDLPRAYACFLKGLHLIEAKGGAVPSERADRLSQMQASLGLSLIKLGKYRLAQQYLELSLEHDDVKESVTSAALANLANVNYQLDRLPIAAALAVASVRLARKTGRPSLLGATYITLANTRAELRDFRGAARLLEQALSLFDNPESRESIIALYNLANCSHELGEHERAGELYAKGLALAAKSGNPRLRARGLFDRGRSLFGRKRYDDAKADLTEARSIGLAHGYTSETFHSTYYLWRMAVERKVGVEAVELFKWLKQLRVRLDQRSEEILDFDACQKRIRQRSRSKPPQ